MKEIADTVSTLPARQRAPDPETTPRFPRALTSFVGRRLELETISTLVLEPGVQLISLTGPGGVGKTRLALRVAEVVAPHFERSGFVDCAPMSHDAQVVPAIAGALGVRESATELVERIATSVGSRHALLVLDNLEHLTTIGPSIVQLLLACPHLVMLVTSQVSLRVTGEREIAIAPLPDDDAALLFADRARSIRATFQMTNANKATIARLCQGLDGLPLAIELAAARAKVLSPEAMLSRLEHRLSLLTGGPRDQPTRLHSMREAITWSHDLLSEPEQRSFRRLAIFSGSFDLDAADRVALGGDMATVDPLESLSSMVDKNLLRVEETSEPARFRMLESIRAFGLELLDLHGERDELRSLHAAYYSGLAATSEPWMVTADRARWLQPLESDYANLRAALDWHATQANAEALLRLNAALAWFWYFQGHLEEGRYQLRRARERGSSSFGVVWAQVLRASARLEVAWGDNELATGWAHESLAIFQAADDLDGSAMAYSTLAALAEHRKDDAEAERCYRASLTILRRLDSHLMAAFALGNLGDVVYRRGDLEQAAVIAIESLELARTLGDSVLTAMVLGNAGYIALERGDLSGAHRSFAEGVRSAHQGGRLPGTADTVASHASLAFHAGDVHRAARWMGAAETLNASFGIRALLHERQAASIRALLRHELGDEAYLAAWTEGGALSLEDAMTEVLAYRLPGDAGHRPETPKDDAALSPRERDVLALLVAGQSNRQIGESLFISHRTVQIHVANILAKLDVSTRAAAAAVAVRDGLVDRSIPPA